MYTLISNRWMRAIASEKRMRAESVDFVGDNLSTELAPLNFVKDGHNTTEIRNMPISYTPHLCMKVKDVLEFNDDDSRGRV